MPVLSRAVRTVSAAAVLSLALAGAWELGARRSDTASDPRAGAGEVAHEVSRAQDGWTDSWVAMQQLTEPSNLPPAPFTGPDGVLKDATVRQTVRATAGGTRVRVTLSNEFGGAPLPVTKVAIARPAGGSAGSAAIEAGSSRPLTFSGRSSVTIPQGARYVSDPVGFRVSPGENLTVTLYLAAGQASQSITSHPGSRTTTYLVPGDHVTDDDVSTVAGTASVAHWYFLSNLETDRSSIGTVVVGDSLSDGRGSTTDNNDRWPDQLFDRVRAAGLDRVSILNEAAGGNRVLADGLGPSVVSRIDRDVLSQSGASRAIVFEGVNDIGVAAATPAAQREVTEGVIAGLHQLILRARARGLRVYGATITPFGKNETYDDAGGLREQSRQAVNRWIRTSGEFDAVLDFDKAVRDPDHPDRLQESLSAGDWLHLNPTGYARLAQAVPLDLLD